MGPNRNLSKPQGRRRTAVMANVRVLKLFYMMATGLFTVLSALSLVFFFKREETPGILLCVFLLILAAIMYTYGTWYVKHLKN